MDGIDTVAILCGGAARDCGRRPNPCPRHWWRSAAGRSSGTMQIYAAQGCRRFVLCRIPGEQVESSPAPRPGRRGSRGAVRRHRPRHADRWAAEAGGRGNRPRIVSPPTPMASPTSTSARWPISHADHGDLATMTSCGQTSIRCRRAGWGHTGEGLRSRSRAPNAGSTAAFSASSPAPWTTSPRTASSSASRWRRWRRGRLHGFRHEGFWDCMDTYKDAVMLNDLWSEGGAPWKVWD
jgi:glucose-1-phosphate cytidylyltransferase